MTKMWKKQEFFNKSNYIENKTDPFYMTFLIELKIWYTHVDPFAYFLKLAK